MIVGAKHPWATCDEIAIKQLKDADWILREGGAATRQLILATLAEERVPTDDLRVAMELGSVETVEAAVEAGHGVSFVSHIAVQRGLQLGQIKTVTVKGLDVQRQILLARNKLRTCTCAPLRFREFVASAERCQLIDERRVAI